MGDMRAEDAVAVRPPAGTRAPAGPEASPPARAGGAWTLDAPGVLGMQARIGNQAVGRILRAQRGPAPAVALRAGPRVQRALDAEAMNALVAQVQRGDETTEAEVRTVLEYMNIGDRINDLLRGHTVHFHRLDGGHLGKNCHHFAFGGLTGQDATFNVLNLGQLLGAALTFEQYHEAHQNDDFVMDAELYAVAGPVMDFARLQGAVVNATQALDLHGDSADYDVRVYDEMAHSARRIDGRWWHKFVNFPFVMAVEGADDLGYAVTANLQVRAPVAALGAAGSFTVPALAQQ
jgi:hypothetical protein